MEPAPSTPFPPPPVCVIGQLSGNSRLGFGVAESTLHQGFKAGKYLIGIGDTASVVPNPWLESLKVQQQKLNINKMVQYADTHAKSRSTERCAYACRMAFQAGGMNTAGHPVDAGDYGPFLIRHGASVVSPKGYKPLKGDVVVFNKTQYYKFGHIEMYNGKGWVSDFKQHSMVPFFSHVPPYTIYRFPND